ncbi:MAG: DUF4364 family protein [Lachnospiraceae bacterium]|nr:DUF4364 family protein [Lachnospiraceae bacterium]
MGFVLISDNLMLSKLIILYILDKTNGSFSERELVDIIVDKHYTTYFNIVNAITELVDDGFAKRSETTSGVLEITEYGSESLNILYKDISVSIRDEIDQCLSEKMYMAQKQLLVSADYYSSKPNEFYAELHSTERGNDLFKLTILAPSEACADIMCNNWKKLSSEIYDIVMSSLLSGEITVPTNNDSEN